MFKLIAGPCVIESRSMILEHAKRMKEITDRLEIPFYFKSSFDKANRTSITSYRGPGIEEGLDILQEAKDTLGVRIVTDIHEPWQAAKAAKVADILQIPAFLCRQTDLLAAAAQTGKPVNVKKAQFLAPWDMKNVVDKLKASGCTDIMLCERGTTFGYNTLVVDMTSLVELEKLGCPVVFDATHSVQKPGGSGICTGGNSEYVEPLAKSALATGAVSWLFMEVHENPALALSDGPNMISLEHLETLLSRLKRIYEAAQEMPKA